MSKLSTIILFLILLAVGTILVAYGYYTIATRTTYSATTAPMNGAPANSWIPDEYDGYLQFSSGDKFQLGILNWDAYSAVNPDKLLFNLSIFQVNTLHQDIGPPAYTAAFPVSEWLKQPLDPNCDCNLLTITFNQSLTYQITLAMYNNGTGLTTPQLFYSTQSYDPNITGEGWIIAGLGVVIMVADCLYFVFRK